MRQSKEWDDIWKIWNPLQLWNSIQIVSAIEISQELNPKLRLFLTQYMWAPKEPQKMQWVWESDIWLSPDIFDGFTKGD